MTDNLYKSRYTTPETNTGFYAFSGPFVTLPINLAEIVGYVPANLNWMWWNNSQTNTLFDEASKFIFPGASVTSGFLGPTGGYNAYHLTEDNSTGVHGCSQPYPATPAVQTQTITPIPWRVALIAREAERSRIVLEMNACDATGTPTANTSVSVGFNLETGVTNYNNVDSSLLQFISASMTSLKNGWYLCQMDVKNLTTYAGGGQLWDFHIKLDNGSGTAANSTSYTGDGSSGVMIWWLSVLPAAAWNINTQAFFDDFNSISTIDTGNTRVAGFNWYVNNNFPNCAGPDFNNNPPLTTPTSSGSISVNNSALTLFEANNNQTLYFATLNTIADNVTSDGYVGTTFQAPMFYESSISFDPSAGAWKPYFLISQTLAYWALPREFLTDPTNTEYVEWDIMEWQGPPDSGQVAHYFTGYSPGHEFTTNIVLSGSGVGNPTVTGFNTYSSLWLTSAATGTNFGMMVGAFNGKIASSNDKAYDLSGNTQPDTSGSGASNFPVGEIQHYPIVLETPNNTTANAGGGFSASFDWVKVYTT